MAIAGFTFFTLSACEDTIVNNYFPAPGNDISKEEPYEIDLQLEAHIDPEISCILKTFIPDKDNDGYGIKDNPKESCQQLEGFVEYKGKVDCDDTNEKIHPGGLEVCDGLDNDCDCLNLPLKDQDSNGDGEKCSFEDNNVDEGLDCCEPGDIKDMIYCPPYDFVFVIDNSGSMDYNDPGKIRYDGLHEFVNKMENDDRGLVIPFASSYKVISYFTNDNVTLHQFITEAQGSDVGEFTFIGKAVNEAISQLIGGNNGKAIILLTDGITDDNDSPGPIALSKEATQKGIRLYALGLGEGVDMGYLEDLATYSAGHFFIKTAKQIPQIYDSIFEGLKYKEWKSCTENHLWVQKLNDCE